MPFIEAPTTFYLGRRYDPGTSKLTDEVVYYDSRDLTTHAVVVGMTGSGKTGLCINLLEEAILDNIPAIIVDPKGDITNLLLNFPELRPEDFQPWVNVDDARRAGLDVPQYSADIAHRWRDGLGSWGISQDRMRWLKLAGQTTIYTPGSDAGLPVSILASLRAPREGWAGNAEGNRERINAITTALLALVGRDAQPVQDKEHVLIANLFEYAWQRGQDLTLEQIILQVQRPPFEKLGVFPIDEYISERQRAKLAMELNSIVAAPSFQSWLNGVPLDIQNLLYSPNGRPRVSIFYIAHLNESERQFILTLLLENILGWMRMQAGTTSLRALLYIDEIFGYFPPHPKNPPTKEPMLRLLKQARAFGLGLILATQNPADLDYKGLSNAGTWFIGRLQSEFDQRRVMAGLESLATTSTQINLQDAGRMIQDIPPRVFLTHNVHDPSGPVMVHTRWAMSYLRGPLTRQQISVLMAEQRAAFYARSGQSAPAPAAAPSYTPPTPAPAVQAAPATASPYYSGQIAAASQAAPPPPPTLPGMPIGMPAGLPEAPASLPDLPPVNRTTSTPPPAPAPRAMAQSAQGLSIPPGYGEHQPPLSSTIAQYFVMHDLDAQRALSQWSVRTGFSTAGTTGQVVMAYRPYLLAQAAARYQDKRTGVYTAREYAYMVPDIDRAGFIQWDQYEVQPFDLNQLLPEPAGQAIFGDVPPGMADPKRYTALRREVTDLIYSSKPLRIPFVPELDLYGDPAGDFGEFRARVQQVARERRDAETDALTQKYEKIINRIEQEEERKLQRLRAEKRELSNLKREQLFTTGEAVLSLLRGRTAYTLSRMSRSGVYKERSQGQMHGYELDLEQLEEEKQQAVDQYQAEIQRLNEKWAKAATNIQEHLVTAYKKDIALEVIGVGWVPFWFALVSGQPVMLPALQGGQ
ncbi:MAG: DUF87 domain-containing protein [Chloroflexi bacterium]|nr:DUF87 domain-containing protein [Chloroflexota bacterium]